MRGPLTVQRQRLAKDLIKQMTVDDVDLREVAPILVNSLARFRLTGLLVFGSAANGKLREGSDVDLLGLSEARGRRYVIRTIRQRPYEIFVGDESYFRRSMSSGLSNCNSFVLRGLVEGTIIYESDDLLSRLKKIAGQMWKQGPNPLHGLERRRVRAGLLKQRFMLEGFEKKAARSAEWDGLIRSRCEVLFLSLVQTYARVNGQWSSSLADIVERDDIGDDVLRAIVRSYICASDLTKRIKCIEQLGAGLLSRMAEPDLISK